MKESERMPEIGDIFSKRHASYQDWVVVEVYKSTIDGIQYTRLRNKDIGDKSVSAVELTRRGSDWLRKTPAQS
ncbi:hypothetical protein [Kiloniella sp.]|uniref:hypothetical protein n=1 Tax=Kiloniella sp. TaxID=1938587 RepID=UPI003B01F7CB